MQLAINRRLYLTFIIIVHQNFIKRKKNFRQTVPLQQFSRALHTDHNNMFHLNLCHPALCGVAGQQLPERFRQNPFEELAARLVLVHEIVPRQFGGGLQAHAQQFLPLVRYTPVLLRTGIYIFQDNGKGRKKKGG